jgi:hypothetical protein
MKGVTIKDALDAIYKQYRKKVYVISPPSPLGDNGNYATELG